MTKTIMIVDDSPEILNLYTSMLKHRGYDVIAAEEGSTALDLVRESTPDLFLLDVMMPGINGIELCQKLREMPQFAETPVIIVSAYSDSGIVEQLFAAGANDYVFKPIDPKKLAVKIKDLLAVPEG